MIGSPCHSGPQKRIEKESNKKLTNELAGLVGESFEEAAKPRAQEVPSVSPAVSETGVFDKFWSAYPNCIYKKPNAKARCCALYMLNQIPGDIFSPVQGWGYSRQNQMCV